jgi:small subunit ribosomal protein S18
LQTTAIRNKEGIKPTMANSRPLNLQKKMTIKRRKLCKFCVEKIDHIDYKDTKLLSQFVPERGKITPRRISGTCAPHQRQLALALKRARHIALLPFTD